MMKERRNLMSRYTEPLKRRRRSQGLTTVVSFRISDDELLLLRRLEKRTHKTASELLRGAFSCILQRECES